MPNKEELIIEIKGKDNFTQVGKKVEKSLDNIGDKSEEIVKILKGDIDDISEALAKSVEMFGQMQEATKIDTSSLKDLIALTKKMSDIANLGQALTGDKDTAKFFGEIKKEASAYSRYFKGALSEVSQKSKAVEADLAKIGEEVAEEFSQSTKAIEADLARVGEEVVEEFSKMSVTDAIETASKDMDTVEKESGEATAAIERFKNTTKGIDPSNIKAYASAVGRLTTELKQLEAQKTIRTSTAVLNDPSASLEDQIRASANLSSAYKTLSSSSEQASTSTQKLGSSVKKTNGLFSNFGGSLLRIAKLRMLRGIVRTVTQAFSEGVSNIYEYSKALGSTDASNVAGNMDHLASTFLHVKNAIGSIVAPLLNALAPVLDFIADKIIFLSNLLAQFFAALGGKDTYTKAKRVETAWKGVDDSTGSTNQNLKEIKRTIMGFDELNVLDSPDSGGGGGGGGGGSSPSPSEMFEEAELETDGIIGLTNELAKAIKPIIDGAKDTIEGLGDAWTGTYKVIEGLVTKDYPTMMEGFEKMWEGVRKIPFLSWLPDFSTNVKEFFENLFYDIKMGSLKVLYWLAKNPVAAGLMGIKLPEGAAEMYYKEMENLYNTHRKNQRENEFASEFEHGNVTAAEFVASRWLVTSGITGFTETVEPMAEKLKTLADRAAEIGLNSQEAKKQLWRFAQSNPKFAAILKSTGDVDGALDAIISGQYEVEDGFITIGETRIPAELIEGINKTYQGMADADTAIKNVTTRFKSKLPGAVKKAVSAFKDVRDGVYDTSVETTILDDKTKGIYQKSPNTGYAVKQIDKVKTSLKNASKQTGNTKKAIRLFGAWRPNLLPLKKQLGTVGERFEEINKKRKTTKDDIRLFGQYKPSMYTLKEQLGTVGERFETINKKRRTTKDNIRLFGQYKPSMYSIKEQLGTVGAKFESINSKRGTTKENIRLFGQYKPSMFTLKEQLGTVGAKFESINQKRKTTKENIRSFGIWKPATSILRQAIAKPGETFGKFKDWIGTAKERIRNFGTWKPKTSDLRTAIAKPHETFAKFKDWISTTKERLTNFGKFTFSTDGISNSLSTIKSAGDVVGTTMGNVIGYAQSIANTYMDTHGITDGLDSIYTSAYNANSILGSVAYNVGQIQASVIGKSKEIARAWLEEHGVKGYAKGGIIQGYAKGGLIPAFASGGINSANLFAANENGLPELVGRIGNRPGVANTGMLVDAMAEGVYRAMMDANRGETSTEVNVFMDSERVARASQKGQRTLNRRFNVAVR